MELDTKTAKYSTSDKSSFAYVSARDRWPVILTGCIDDVHQATGRATDEVVRSEGKRIIEELAKLKHEMQHDRVLTPIVEDGQPDIVEYNKELEHLGPSPTWFNLPWLFTECYLYRRMHTLFSLSTAWRNYDVFARQKLSTFRSSRPAVLELASKYHSLLSSPPAEPPSAVTQSLIFREMLEISLWGNATDLSLLTSLTYADIQALQGSSARAASEANIVANDISDVYALLSHLRTTTPADQPRQVDIILDNSGFELYVDLLLAGYLLATNLATSIVLHPKSIPWFVSDVIPADFAALLSALADPQTFFGGDSATDNGKSLSSEELSHLTFLFHQLTTFHSEGQLRIRPHSFWTSAGSFWRLPSSAPDLYRDLCESELVVFKGDLNYRKLTGDAMWDPTTPWAEALGPLGVFSEHKGQPRGMRTLALRTCKADVVVGLDNGIDEKLRQETSGDAQSPKREWAWSGKYAVVQFFDGKSAMIA